MSEYNRQHLITKTTFNTTAYTGLPMDVMISSPCKARPDYNHAPCPLVNHSKTNQYCYHCSLIGNGTKAKEVIQQIISDIENNSIDYNYGGRTTEIRTPQEVIEEQLTGKGYDINKEINLDEQICRIPLCGMPAEIKTKEHGLLCKKCQRTVHSRVQWIKKQNKVPSEEDLYKPIFRKKGRQKCEFEKCKKQAEMFGKYGAFCKTHEVIVHSRAKKWREKRKDPVAKKYLCYAGKHQRLTEDAKW